jgi:photosystem II stability/assembly factor-like uncharacterized protein
VSRLPSAAKGFCGIAHVGRTVHAVGRYEGAADYFVSHDAGTTWTKSELSAFASGLVDVEFLDADVGFISGMGRSTTNGAGQAVVLKTTDGGRTWRSVYEGGGPRSWGWKLFVVSPTLIYLGIETSGDTLRIARTTDAGETWRTFAVGRALRASASIQGIGFVDASTGFVGGFFPGMYATTDSGRTWSFVDVDVSTVNRYTKAGSALVTAGSTGILRYDRGAQPRPAHNTNMRPFVTPLPAGK